MAKPDLYDILKNEPNKFFSKKDSEGDDWLKDRVTFLGKDVIADEKIEKIINETTYRQFAPMIDEYLKADPTINTFTNIYYFLENIGKLVKEIEKKGKFSDVVKQMHSNKTLSKILSESKLIFLIKKLFIVTLFDSLTQTNNREALVKEIHKGTLVDFIIDSYEEINITNKYVSEDILKIGEHDNDLKKELVDRLKKDDTAVETFEAFATFASSEHISFVTRDLSDEEFKKLIDTVGLEKTEKYMKKMPQFFKERVAKLNPNIFKDFKEDTIIEIINNIRDTSKLNEVYGKLEKGKRDKVKGKLGNPTVDDVATTISDINDKVNSVVDNYKTVRKNIWANRFGSVTRLRNSIAAKILELRVKNRENKVIKLADFNTRKDRIGLIGRIQLLRYKRNHEKYLELNDRLNKRLDNIKTLDEDKEERLKENQTLKDEISKSKKEIKGATEAAKKRKKNTETLKRLAELAKEEKKINRADKLGKIELSESKVAQAWGLLVDSGELESIDEKGIKSIISTNQRVAGKLSDEELRELVGQITFRLAQIREEAKDDDSVLDKRAVEEATKGLSMGISNYALIMAVTAITITGLIILLTTILS